MHKEIKYKSFTPLALEAKNGRGKSKKKVSL